MISNVTRFVAAGAAAFAFSLPAAAQSFDASTDFSTTANPSNGWSYGWSPSLLQPFQLASVAGNLCGTAARGWSPGNYLGVYKNTAAQSSTCQTAAYARETVILHPGSSGQYAKLRWTSPGTGFCTISVAFTGADVSFPTSSDVAVLYNGTAIASAAVDSYAEGFVFATTINVLAGETIDFAVGYGSNQTFNGDSTAVDASIEFGLGGSSARVGRGCGSDAELTTSAPRLGSLMNFDVANAQPGLACGLGLSQVPSTSVHLGDTCTAFLDPPTLLFFPIQTIDATGACTNLLQIPVNGALLHAHFALQAVLLPANVGLGFELSNGVLMTLGT